MPWNRCYIKRVASVEDGIEMQAFRVSWGEDEDAEEIHGQKDRLGTYRFDPFGGEYVWAFRFVFFSWC